MRLGPDEGQTLRVLGADLSWLPQDRESPVLAQCGWGFPKAHASQGSVQLAYHRTRIKLFYRPPGLAGSRWRSRCLAGLAGPAGGGLRVTNPGPFPHQPERGAADGRRGGLAWREGGVPPPYGGSPCPWSWRGG